ncbi:MAG: hypothetical protein H6742_04640 [Alphaproteobacteria bacterium]|nr:hypothetical protein [Alphaproteobacteria bacterium]
MARSLTVKHEEAPATSPLLTAFLVLAFGWLAVAGIVAMIQDAGASEAPAFYTE